MENIADHYYKLLKDTTKPGVELANMYNAIFDIKLERKHYMMFNKLVRLYGRFNVFSAMLVIAGKDDVNHKESLIPLFTWICKKGYESRTSSDNVESMKAGIEIINGIEAKIKKLRKIKLRIPDEDTE